MCVCLFSIEIQNAGWIGIKFGTEEVLVVRRFWFFLTWYPPPGYGVCKGGMGCLSHEFWQKLYKTKVEGRSDLVEGWSPFWAQIRIQKDLGPMSFWSHGHSL